MASYVIAGAGVAGATAAITLRAEAPDADITLIGGEPDAPYERPPLSKAYLRGERTFDRVLVRPPSFYAEQRIHTLFGTRVTRVDAAGKAVELAGGQRLAFDALLLATGGRARQPAIPGSDLQGIHTLRSVRDADAIRTEIAPGRRAVVVGMGFIGAEVAASLRESGVDVVAIEPAKAPMARALGDDVGNAIARLHRAHGVRLLLEDAVESFGGGPRVAEVVTRGGVHVPCDFAVVGLGIQPEVDALAGSGIDISNGVAVDARCETRVPGIFAAGDVANHAHPIVERPLRVEHYQNAVRQGAAAARNMLGRGVVYDEVHWFWSDQYNANLQYAGFPSQWTDLVVRGRLDGDTFLAFYLTDQRIDAVVSFNRPRDVRRIMPIIKARTVVDAKALADETVELR